MRSSNRQLREQIAREAARIMVAGGSRDFQGAKRKAADRLGARRRGQLPSNGEIEAAIRIHQRLFESHTQPRRLGQMRRVALDVIRFLARFEPYLVGPVLHGTADHNCDVHLHLFAEPSEEVGRFLDENGIRHRLGQRHFRYAGGETRIHPAYRYIVHDVPVELAVFSHRDRGHPPLSPIDGRPMRRAGASSVERLAEATRRVDLPLEPRTGLP